MSRSITPAPTPPQTLIVSTAAGFNAGDLVYFNGSTGDYGTPTPTTQTSVTVPATTSVPLLGGITGANSSDVGIYGACASKNFADILTDGNIVQVFINANTNYPSFRVVSTAGAIVVAETAISSVLTQSGAPNIGVAALTGGGFAVAWINGTGGTVDRPCYAVYSNAGVVVSAAQQDLGGVGAGSAAQTLNIKPTPSGGFILSYYTTGTAISARGYAANGVAAFGWVSLTAAGINQTHGLAVRSNGDFVLVGVVDNNNITYAIWSSIGAAIVGATSFTLINGTSFQAQTDALCLSDGTTFVLVYKVVITNDTVAFRFLPTGNVLGTTEFYIPQNNFYKSGGSYSYPLTATALSSNRFIVITAASVPNAYPISYAIFDSTGACLSGTSGTTSTAALPISIPQAVFVFSGLQITALESPSGFISLYYTNRNSAKNYSLQVAMVNATTYAPVNVTPTTQLAGSVTGTPVAYAPSGSSPLGAAFSIAPDTYNAVGTYGEIIKSPELVTSVDVGSIATTTLPDGRVLVAYSGTAAGSIVSVAVYSITGVLTQTISIAAMGVLPLSTFSKISISALSSGKFVIAYASSATTYAIRLYSSTFTQIGSTESVTCPGGVASGYIASVSGLTGDRYVVLYSGTTNYLNYRVYDNTNTMLISDVIINSGVDMKQAAVCGYSGGGFMASAKITTNAQHTAQFGNPSGNTFTQIVAFTTVTAVTNTLANARPVANTAGNVFMNYASSASGIIYYGSTIGTNTGVVNSSMGSLTSIESSAVGVAGNGYPALTGQTSGVMQLATATEGVVALNSVLVKPYVAGAFSQNSMTPSYGANIGIAYIDTSNKVRYMIVCANTFPVKATLVSTDPSTAISIYPGTASGTAVQNTIFTGVALQTVPAGGAGAVQISGPAQLNSNYPAGTTYRAFDHQSQGVPGVKGSIVGRAITLQGT